ncbi:acyl-CoA dehydrogenase family protein [Streptomyces sp. JJ36]|uniref:acyl-CoA dehydrogenase family protein n=1 Tax=Streptomyces sp. JJ36 TaxID=2736645 RepID=UPI001F1AC081|nr:acyl-CoA dehydrogenase family protein [Streptomyces sp. JJ36]MCF6524773.1 acyl-CoA/acyl-ACP dehydrogenase [Streptomyces sp. JJ36]
MPSADSLTTAVPAGPSPTAPARGAARPGRAGPVPPAATRAAGPDAPSPATLLDQDTRDRLEAAAEAADRSGLPDREAVAVLRGSRLPGLVVPRRYGGAGGGAVELNAAVEQVAAVNASAAIMLFQHYAVCSRIAECGTAEQHRTLLPDLASGRLLAASAWSETGAGADKKNLATTARPAPDGGWILDGAKSFTTSAGLADLYLVLAQSGSGGPDEGRTAYGSAGQTFFLVAADNPGLRPDTSLRLTGMRGSATGFVSVRDCRVADGARLGAAGTAAAVIAGVRESGASLGTVAVGIAQAALETAHAHAERRGLLAHQAVRHRLVGLATRVEAARALVERAGRRTSADPGMTTLHSKLFASSAAEEVVGEVESMLGSAGYVDSHPINRYRRDVRAVALMGPTNDLCKELVSLPWTP